MLADVSKFVCQSHRHDDGDNAYKELPERELARADRQRVALHGLDNAGENAQNFKCGERPEDEIDGFLKACADLLVFKRNLKQPNENTQKRPGIEDLIGHAHEDQLSLFADESRVLERCDA